LSRKFGVSFVPAKLGKTFSVPQDLILPEYETLDPFERLLEAAAPAISKHGLNFKRDADRQKLTITSPARPQKAAA